MSLVVKNESVLAITVREKDLLAAGVGEEELPSLGACAETRRQVSATVHYSAFTLPRTGQGVASGIRRLRGY